MENKPTPPNNYLALSIITTILCCQIFGIIAIIFSAQVNSKYMAGDYEGAEKASRNAKNWSIAGIGIAFVIFIISFIFFGSAILAALSSGELNF